MNIQCYEFESLVAGILGKRDEDQSDEMKRFAENWIRLDESDQRRLLPTIITRVPAG